MTGSIKTNWEVKNGSICKEQKLDGIGRNWTELDGIGKFDGIRWNQDESRRNWTSVDGLGWDWTALDGIVWHWTAFLDGIE